MTVRFHNLIDVYWGMNCRNTDGVEVEHAQCGGLLEFVPEDGTPATSYDFMRCVDPLTGERYMNY